MGSGGSGVSLRFDLDSAAIEATPTFLGGLGEFVDYRERGFVLRGI
jgi:hypothetical protein